MEKKQSLYELTKAGNDLSSAIIEAGGEITPEIEQALSDLDLKTKDKIDAYKFAMDTLEYRAEQLKEEASIFMNTAKSLMAAQERLKLAIKNNMSVNGTSQVNGNRYTFKLVQLSPKMTIDEKFLEDRFYREEVLKKIDRPTIEQAIKQGESVAGVTLEPVFALRPSINKG